jgi:hypothetical protein
MTASYSPGTADTTAWPVLAFIYYCTKVSRRPPPESDVEQYFQVTQWQNGGEMQTVSGSGTQLGQVSERVCAETASLQRFQAVLGSLFEGHEEGMSRL